MDLELGSSWLVVPGPVFGHSTVFHCVPRKGGLKMTPCHEIRCGEDHEEHLCNPSRIAKRQCVFPKPNPRCASSAYAPSSRGMLRRSKEGRCMTLTGKRMVQY